MSDRDFFARMQRRPLIWWYHQHVGHQLETVLPNCSFSPKKELKSFFLDPHFGRGTVNIDYVKRSSNSLYRIIALNNYLN